LKKKLNKKRYTTCKQSVVCFFPLSIKFAKTEAEEINGTAEFAIELLFDVEVDDAEEL
jgi:hypothetical protein